MFNGLFLFFLKQKFWHSAFTGRQSQNMQKDEDGIQPGPLRDGRHFYHPPSLATGCLLIAFWKKSFQYQKRHWNNSKFKEWNAVRLCCTSQAVGKYRQSLLSSTLHRNIHIYPGSFRYLPIVCAVQPAVQATNSKSIERCYNFSMKGCVIQHYICLYHLYGVTLLVTDRCYRAEEWYRN